MGAAAAAVGARWRTTVLLNIASIVERADEQVLPSVYFFIGQTLHVSPAQLGALTLCRALVQALSCPISGVLGDKYDRTVIIAWGCFIWGIMTYGIGLANTLTQAMVACAVNGFGLALVIPCISSLIADYHPAETRGRAFGTMSLISAIGGMAGGFFATNLGGTAWRGIAGWRWAFHLTATISIFTGFAVLTGAVEPRGKGGERGRGAAGAEASPLLKGGPGKQRSMAGGGIWSSVCSVMHVPTFQLIVLQGVVGMLPWNALVFLTLWLQLLGFSDLSAATCNAVFVLGCALGSLMGGVIGDMAAKRSPGSGRLFTCQTSVAISVPLACIIFKGLPAAPAGAEAGFTGIYSAALFLFGVLISWCGVNNSAMFSEVVPEDQRSTIYAFDRAFEGAVGACAMPLVGIIAERVFGFHKIAEQSSTVLRRDPENAAALSSSLLVCLVVPWVLCFLSYIGLHWTFPLDRRRVLGATKPAKQQASFALHEIAFEEDLPVMSAQYRIPKHRRANGSQEQTP